MSEKTGKILAIGFLSLFGLALLVAGLYISWQWTLILIGAFIVAFLAVLSVTLLWRS